MAAKLESPPEEMGQGAVYFGLFFHAPCSRNYYTVFGGYCQLDVSLRGALFAPKLVLSLAEGQSPIRKVGIASPAARNDIRNLKIFKTRPDRPYLFGDFRVYIGRKGAYYLHRKGVRL